jgi:hypothetical protein
MSPVVKQVWHGAAIADKEINIAGSHLAAFFR